MKRKKTSSRIDLSERKKRLQVLIDKELKKRESESRIPREHYREREVKGRPYVKIVDAEYEIFTPATDKEKHSPAQFSWDFYLLIFSLLTSCLLGGLLVVQLIANAIGKLMQ